MSVFHDNVKAVEAAQKKAHQVKEQFGADAAKSSFIFDMINHYNETLAGDVTLIDGRVINHPKIQHRFEI